MSCMKRLIKSTKIKTFKLSLLNIIHVNVINTKSKGNEMELVLSSEMKFQLKCVVVTTYA